MTRTEEQLAELLHRATAEVDGVPFEDVARRARRHRRIAASASAIAVAALTAGPATAGAALAGHVQDRPAASGNHHVASLTRHRRIAFEGVLCTLPSGWKTTTQPSCGWPASNTLVINYRTGPVLYCPAPFQPASLPTSVTLTTIYGPQYADGWAGQRTTWHGQPAWLAVHARGRGSSTAAAVRREGPRRPSRRRRARRNARDASAARPRSRAGLRPSGGQREISAPARSACRRSSVRSI